MRVYVVTLEERETLIGTRAVSALLVGGLFLPAWHRSRPTDGRTDEGTSLLNQDRTGPPLAAAKRRKAPKGGSAC